MDLEPLACEDDAQTRQNICCSHIKSMDIYECSDQNLRRHGRLLDAIRAKHFVLHVGRMPLLSSSLGFVFRAVPKHAFFSIRSLICFSLFRNDGHKISLSVC